MIFSVLTAKDKKPTLYFCNPLPGPSRYSSPLIFDTPTAVYHKYIVNIEYQGGGGGGGNIRRRG